MNEKPVCPECFGVLHKRGTTPNQKQQYGCPNPECSLKRTISPAWLRDNGKVAYGNDEEKKDYKFETTNDDGELTVSLDKEIISVDDAIAYAGVDTKTWEVVNFSTNSYSMGYIDSQGEPQTHPIWQVKVWFKKKKNDCSVLWEDICSKILTKEPVHFEPLLLRQSTMKKDDERYMAEIAIMDFHLGKLSYNGGSIDEDLKESLRVFNNVILESIKRMSPFKPEKILFPVGNDFFNVDNFGKTTTKGTPQDTERVEKVYDTGADMLIDAIDILREIASVDILVIPGNHDLNTAYWIGKVLEARYQSADNVFVDARKNSRKYYKYGRSLIGFTHGGKNSPRMNALQGVMTNDCREWWSQIKYAEWHIGHVHKAREVAYTAYDSISGVKVRTIPSLSSTDDWLFDHGYVCEPKQSEVLIWHHEDGLHSQHFINAKRTEKNS